MKLRIGMANSPFNGRGLEEDAAKRKIHGNRKGRDRDGYRGFVLEGDLDGTKELAQVHEATRAFVQDLFRLVEVD